MVCRGAGFLYFVGKNHFLGDAELKYSNAYSLIQTSPIGILLSILSLLSTGVYAQDSTKVPQSTKVIVSSLSEVSSDTPTNPKSQGQSQGQPQPEPQSQIQSISSQVKLSSSSYFLSSSSLQAPPQSQPALVKKLDSILYPQEQDSLKKQTKLIPQDKVQSTADTTHSQVEPKEKHEKTRVDQKLKDQKPKVQKQPQIQQQSIKKTPSIGPALTPEKAAFNCQRPKLEWKWEFSYFSRDHLKKQIMIDIVQDTNRIFVQAINQKGQEIHLEFNEIGQTMWYGINDVPRGLALHHLRERLFDSPLLLEDFKVLNRLVYQCPEHDQRDSVFLKDSLVSYSNLKTLEEPSAWRQYQYRWKAWKHWYFKAWLQAPSWEARFPSLIDITGQGEETGRLQLKSLKVDGRVIGIPKDYPIPIKN